METATQHHRPELTMGRLLRRGLGHYWKINLTVMLAAAVGVAVLTGSLLVGASVRGSMREQALRRLGPVTHAVLAETFFREALGGRPERHAAIVLTGTVAQPDGTRRANKVQVLGLPKTSLLASENDPAWPGLGEDTCLLNPALASHLGLKTGEEVLVRVPKPSAVPRETFIGERDDTVATLRLRVAGTLREGGTANFTLGASQLEPLNVFVPLASLQRRLGEPGKVNALLLGTDGEKNPLPQIREAVALEDVGLSVKVNATPKYLSVESSQIFLPPYLTGITTQSAAQLKATARPTLTYLANKIQSAGRSTPYSLVAALDDAGLKPGEIALNQWLADDLQARAGDKISLTCYMPAAGWLTESTATLTVAKVVPLAGKWADRGLTPEFPGIREATTLTKWDAPFPIELKRIRPRDEDYWTSFRATPKAFVALATGLSLWRNPYGNFTSIRVEGTDEAALRATLRQRLEPERAGMRFEPVRERALAASAGASDFGGLFIGFSLFLLVAAAMLIRILFQLGVQGRAREYGLLSATGFTARQIRRLMLAEGALIAAGGGVLGLLLGVGYAGVLVHGLRTWWVGAIGAPFLRLHLDGASLVGGLAGGWLVAVGSVWLASRQLAKIPARALLAGRSVEAGFGRRQKRAGLSFGVLFLLLGVGLAAGAPRLAAQDQAAVFFGAGSALLIASLAFFRVWLRRPPQHSAARGLTLTRLGVLAARRRPGRSMLVAGLMACATFLIVAVGANRHTARPTTDKRSGAGGFTLLAESAMPLFKPLDPAQLKGATAYGLRLRPGDDASCLNLYKAARPRILGVPPAFVRRGGFLFAQSLAQDDAARHNPWLLLERPLDDGAIPVIGDYNSVVWLLHSGLGKEITVEGHRLRFVALLKGSILQSELTIAERHFIKLFPGEGGWRMFAIEVPPASAQTLTAALESKYEDAGLEAASTARRLNALLAVENTYLATFQALGGLGLLLGTLGMALALLRNLLERRAELALLRAVGYRFSRLLWLAVSENLLLMAVGLVAGAGCALLAVWPALASRAAEAPWASLGATLLGVLLLGIVATAASAAAVLRAPLIWSLKVE